MRSDIIYAEENRGYSAGNNIGLRRAMEIGAKYALVINPDMELTDVNYIARLVEVMERDEDIVVAATDVVTPEGIHQNPMLPDGDWHSAFGWVKEIFNRKKPVDTYSFIDNYKESHECAKVSGCCLMLRMSFVEEIGCFDEYPFLYCEEAILARQVEMAGKKMYYLADTQAVHRHVKSEKGDPVKRFKHWERSRIYFYKRYSKDSWWGRWISILSMRLYVLVFTMYKRVNGR
jgi:GT2 family glycosyltransferase